MAEASSKPGPAVKRKRRPVEVVVCPDIPAPSSAAAAARRQQRPGGAHNGGGRPGAAGGGDEGGGKAERAAEREEFKRMWKSVMDLGAAQLTGYEKKMYEARRIVELGGRAPKSEKTPLNILVGKRAKRKQRDSKREQEVRESGMVVAKKRLSAHALAAEGKEAAAPGMRHKKLGSGDIGASPYPVVGKMRGGTLFLSRDTVRSVTAKSRGGGRGGGGRGRWR